MTNLRFFLEFLTKFRVNLPWRIWTSVCCFLSLVALVLLQLTPSQYASAASSTNKVSKPALTISVVKAISTQFDDSIEVSGSFAPWQEAIIGAPLAGLRIDELYADVGDFVHKGQVLAKYNVSSLRALEAQNTANVAQAKATYTQASINNQRAIGLKNSGSISEQDLLQFATQEATAKAQFESSQATLTTTQIQLRDTRIVAPDDGIISTRSATLGSIASVGQELFKLIRQGRIEWHPQLTSFQANRVAVGKAVLVSLPDSAPVKGRVRLISPSSDTQSRLLTVYVELEKSSFVHSGMYATGRINLGLRNIVSIPVTSIVVRDGSSYIFVVKQFGGVVTVQRQKVLVGQTQGQRVEILSGLIVGEEVASLGAGFLEDGDVVRISSESLTK